MITKTKVEKRMKASFKKLQKIANDRTPHKKDSVTNALIGTKVGLSGQSVANYRKGEGGNGYMIDALIEEFEKLPVPKPELN